MTSVQVYPSTYHEQEDGSDWILSFRCQGLRGGMAPDLFPGSGQGHPAPVVRELGQDGNMMCFHR
jgi:hypothetical protein